jgi:hypothetical protein
MGAFSGVSVGFVVRDVRARVITIVELREQLSRMVPRVNIPLIHRERHIRVSFQALLPLAVRAAGR